jgi:hypothetical protein
VHTAHQVGLDPYRLESSLYLSKPFPQTILITKGGLP